MFLWKIKASWVLLHLLDINTVWENAFKNQVFSLVNLNQKGSSLGFWRQGLV